MSESVLGRLALARGYLDRVAERRRDEEWLAKVWADPQTRVLVLSAGRCLTQQGPDGPALVLVSPAQAPDGERYLLGVGGDVAYFAVSGPLPTIEGTEQAGLREAGSSLGDRDAGIFTHALALQNWHTTHTHCPRCGTPTAIANAGHTRRCPADGSEHFPRVDPAVIMLVRDSRDRILLAHNPAWPDRRVSILAGFVEPGESLERAVVREVWEEVGLVVHDLEYLGSQPWPLPQSLMLGFFARAAEGQEIRPDQEEIENARWFSRQELAAAIEADEIRIPPSISIARRLIDHWYGADLPAGPDF